jgi:hypothetical protein
MCFRSSQCVLITNNFILSNYQHLDMHYKITYFGKILFTTLNRILP